MTLNKFVRVGDLISSHPSARELLSWYGVGLDARDRAMTLDQLCRSEGLDVEDTLAELLESVDGDFDIDDYERDEDDALWG